MKLKAPTKGELYKLLEEGKHMGMSRHKKESEKATAWDISEEDSQESEPQSVQEN